jgi:integrase
MPYPYKREPLTADEATRLANACQTHQEKLVVWTLLDTSLRVAELAGLATGKIQHEWDATLGPFCRIMPHPFRPALLILGTWRISPLPAPSRPWRPLLSSHDRPSSISSSRSIGLDPWCVLPLLLDAFAQRRMIAIIGLLEY